MAKLIKADGTVTDINPAKDYFTLQELQQLVGGYIEVLKTNDPLFTLIVNEDGKRLRLPRNETATNLTSKIGMGPGDYILGNAVIGSAIELGCEPQE